MAVDLPRRLHHPGAGPRSAKELRPFVCHRAWARFIGGRGLEKAFLNIHAPLLLFVLASGLMYFKNAYRQYRVASKADGEDRSELKPMCHIPSAPDSPA